MKMSARKRVMVLTLLLEWGCEGRSSKEPSKPRIEPAQRVAPIENTVRTREVLPKLIEETSTESVEKREEEVDADIAESWLGSLVDGNLAKLEELTAAKLLFETDASKRKCEGEKTSKEVARLEGCLRKNDPLLFEALSGRSPCKPGWSRFRESWAWAEKRRPDGIEWCSGWGELEGINYDWIIGMRNGKVAIWFLDWEVHE